MTSNLYATIANLRFGKEMYFEVGDSMLHVNLKNISFIYFFILSPKKINADDLLVIAMA